MNSYERARRDHPAQIHADRRVLELMEHYYDETAPEPSYKPRKPKKRLLPRFAMMWRY